MKSINIDLGGTRAKVGIIENGNIIDHSICNSSSMADFSETIENLEIQINTLLGKNKINIDDVVGIGLACPGIVDVKTNRVISTNEKFAKSVEFNFNKWAKTKWGLKIVLDNDARAALIGEWQNGSGKGYDNIVMMTLGTGIGGVCLINGELLYGKHFQAGVLGGHFTVKYDGEMCNCGNIGCVEAISSSWRIKEKITSHKNYKRSKLFNEDKHDYKTLFKYYREDDNVAKEIINESLKAWAAGVVTMIHAYDPEIVIMHGGVMKSDDIILPFIQDWVNKYAWTPWGNVKVCQSSSLDFTALYGTDYLIRRKQN